MMKTKIKKGLRGDKVEVFRGVKKRLRVLVIKPCVVMSDVGDVRGTHFWSRDSESLGLRN